MKNIYPFPIIFLIYNLSLIFEFSLKAFNIFHQFQNLLSVFS